MEILGRFCYNNDHSKLAFLQAPVQCEFPEPARERAEPLGKGYPCSIHFHYMHNPLRSQHTSKAQQIQISPGTQRHCVSVSQGKYNVNSPKLSLSMGLGIQPEGQPDGLCNAAFSPLEPSTSELQKTRKHCMWFLCSIRSAAFAK